MATPNPALMYNKPPSGMPVPGQDLSIEDVQPVPSEAPQDGALVQILYSSFDPYLRGLLRDPEIKSYFPPLKTGEPMKSGSIGKVLKSSNSGFQEGTLIEGFLPIQRYITLSSEELKYVSKLDADPDDKSVDLRHYLGAIGMPGLTAYSSLYEIGQPKRGETIFVSSAAGAVGQIVGQLAKHEGLTVIGSAGSDEKVKYLLEDLKFDSAFNYKKEAPLQALERLAPNGIDIYYENVGGEHLNAAIEKLKTYGRIVACGMISEYNAKPDEEAYGHKNLMKIVGKQLTMRGFIVAENPDFGPKYKDEHLQKVREWLRDGTMVAKIHEWDISEGDKGFVGMLKGENFGKAVVKVT